MIREGKAAAGIDDPCPHPGRRKLEKNQLIERMFLVRRYGFSGVVFLQQRVPGSKKPRSAEALRGESVFRLKPTRDRQSD
jgi:hypothetical protein